MKTSTKAIRFLETLCIPEGPKAGEQIKLAPFQKKFVRGALSEGINVAVLSIGRGNAKTALSAGIALGAAMGKWDNQPRREVLIAARTRDQARIAFDFVVGFMRSFSDDEQKKFTVRRSPRLEIEYDGDGGEHFIRAIAADGKSALGSAPTMVLMDERGHWAADQGDALEHALLSGLGKRGGRALIISTSAADDATRFQFGSIKIKVGSIARNIGLRSDFRLTIWCRSERRIPARRTESVRAWIGCRVRPAVRSHGAAPH